LASLLKLGCVFAGIVVLLSRGWNLGLVLVLASLAVGLLFARPIPLLAGDLIAGAVNILTLRLALAVVLIMTLGELMRRTAALQHMVEALQSLIPGGRIVIASLPSLIGLLPMIGGAMFSAPLVNEVGKRLDATSELKTFINYWFRHMWEPVFPLYPSMLLAAELLNLSPLQLAGTTWPLTVAFLAGGFVFGLRKLPASNPHAIHFDRRSLRLLIRSIWPIVLVIVLSLTLPVDERFGLVVSLLIVITLLTITQHVSPASLVEILYRHIPWSAVFTIFGAMIFQHVLESSGAVVSVAQALVDLHMPVILVAFIAPFIPGLLTGLMAAAYSIGFPLVLPLVITNGSGIACSWAAWLLAGGVLGTMVSPLHLCLALTRAYFSARWGAIYRLVIPSALLVMLAAAGMLLLTK
jgi:integral membrane protein (TIGR00529 family)